MAIEIEIKLAIGLVEPEVRRLRELGANTISPRLLEENILLDFGEGELRARGAMLRVRRYGRSGSVTYKEPAPGPAGFKVRREIETVIPDPGALFDVLAAAGMRAVWRYDKYRTVMEADGVKVLVDETPIGNFLELEGSGEAIGAMARRLGRSPSDSITATYRQLFEDWCRARGREAGDMVFDREPAV